MLRSKKSKDLFVRKKHCLLLESVLSHLCPHCRRADKVPPHQHAADNKADDDKHYRKLDKRKAALCCGCLVHYPCILRHESLRKA